MSSVLRADVKVSFAFLSIVRVAYIFKIKRLVDIKLINPKIAQARCIVSGVIIFIGFPCYRVNRFLSFKDTGMHLDMVFS